MFASASIVVRGVNMRARPPIVDTRGRPFATGSPGTHNSAAMLGHRRDHTAKAVLAVGAFVKVTIGVLGIKDLALAIEAGPHRAGLPPAPCTAPMLTGVHLRFHMVSLPQ